MNERELPGGQRPGHDETLDDPTTLDPVPNVGPDDDPILHGGTPGISGDIGMPADRLPLGTAARPGYGGAWVDPVHGETGGEPGEPGGETGAALDPEPGVPEGEGTEGPGAQRSPAAADAASGTGLSGAPRSRSARKR